MLEQQNKPSLNIKKIVMEKPSICTFFNPRTEISLNDWERIKNEIDSETNNVSYLNMLINAKQLARFSNYPFTPTFRPYIHQYLYNTILSSHTVISDKSNFIDTLYCFNELFPCSFSDPELKTQLTRIDSDPAKKEIRRFNVVPGLTDIMKIYQLNPDYYQNNPLNAGDYEIIKSEIDELKKRDNYWLVLDISSKARLLFPEKKYQLFDTAEMPHFRNLYNKFYNDSDFLAVINIAKDLSILTAPSAKVANDGIELVYPDNTKEHPKLPERRNF